MRSFISYSITRSARASKASGITMKTGEEAGDKSDQRRSRRVESADLMLSVKRDRQPGSADSANAADMHDRMDRA